MVYYRDKELIIRDMIPADARAITDGEIAQGWRQTIEKYELRLRDQRDGKCVALVAEYEGEAAGYIHVYPNSDDGPFAGMGYPEIIDFGVLEKFRRRDRGPLRGAAQRVRQRPAHVRHKGLCPGRLRGVVQRKGARTRRCLPK